MTPDTTAPIDRYFATIDAALDGLDAYLADPSAGLKEHDLMGAIAVRYVERLRASFECWRLRLGFAERFRINRTESGFPAHQDVLELANDRKGATERLAELPPGDDLRQRMVDTIIGERRYPDEAWRDMATRVYLEHLEKADFFAPFVLPETVRVSVNPKTGRPYYVVHWGAFDGTANLPLVYVAVIEDSSEAMVRSLVRDGKLNEQMPIPLPVGGLLNPQLAHPFDAWAEANSSYGLTPSTIATSLDESFDNLHPKQLRRFVLGPFYSAGITEHGGRVNDVLGRIRREENAWLLTWTIQEVFSVGETAAKKGLWSSQPARERFHIETDDLEAARTGVSAYSKNALVPHEAYQALYASGEAADVFRGYKRHVIAGGVVTTDG